ncbi:hypothetical protein AB0D08_34655 [Kitasatospora sp. NPDC048540]|uniref:hypothetical protein n=1 Tax=Kitasatospora sp. NPDC048540 TaxID=3155634 RepID=UPI00053B2579
MVVTDTGVQRMPPCEGEVGVSMVQEQEPGRLGARGGADLVILVGGTDRTSHRVRPVLDRHPVPSPVPADQKDLRWRYGPPRWVELDDGERCWAWVLEPQGRCT